MKRVCLKLLVAAGLLWPTAALAQRLGTGSTPEVPIIRTIAALIACLVVAALAILYLKHRGGARLPMFNRLIRTNPELDIRELRRVTVQHSLCLARYGGREYLLALSPGETLLLSDRPVDDEAKDESA